MSEDPPAGADRTAAPGALVDAAGRVHQPAGANARIVSLVPSITETLFALDLGPVVVGRTAFCVHPRGQVERVQSVGGTKRINAAKLHALAPTHVIVNIDETPRAMAEQLAGAGYCVVVTHPVEVDDNRGLYRLLGALFGREAQADDLRRRFDVAAASLAAAASALPERRVLYLIWQDPWMTVSPATYIARLLARVHWQVIGGDGVARYPEVTLDDRLLDATDLVLFSTEPFPFAERHLQAFRAAHPAHAHKAVLVDGEMTSWYGSRAIAGLRYLAAFARDRAA
ncbi:MAG: ABC transporter substrate-binding protein [Rhodospirillales bacterium]|nr:ABC transporter substrate-binding protein [Rhodospirillales bacterium]